MTNASSLSISTPSNLEVALTRNFNAPPNLVFDAFTKPELLRRWQTGNGAVLEVCEVDLRVGGSYRYIWKMPQGQMGMSGEYLELDPPALLVNTLNHDQPWYPGGTIVTAEFGAVGSGTTLRLSLRFESKEARDIVLATPWAKNYGEGFDALDAVFTEQAK